jgi:outer membrane biosynthesis protein TonB
MHVNPARLAVSASACLACLAGGLLMGVATGGSHAAHLFRVETVTTTIRGHALPARTVTRVVATSDTVTARRTVTAAPRVVEVAARHRSKAAAAGPVKPAHPPGAPAPKPAPTPAPAPSPKPKPKPAPKPAPPPPPKPKPTPPPP